MAIQGLEAPRNRCVKVRVIVTLKPSLLDAQGRVVTNALHAIGHAMVNQVRIGKYMEIEMAAGDAGSTADITSAVTDMCERLLANPVIEDYRFEIDAAD